MLSIKNHEAKKILICPKCNKPNPSFTINIKDIERKRSILPSDFINDKSIIKRCTICHSKLAYRN